MLDHLCILIFPFQVARLTALHEQLLLSVLKEYSRILIILSDRGSLPLSCNSPLGYESRKNMLHEFFLLRGKQINIELLPFTKYPSDNVKRLDMIISKYIVAGKPPIIITSSSFAMMYEEEQGRFPVQTSSVDILRVEKEYANMNRKLKLNDVPIDEDPEEAFRLGCVFSASSHYPTSFQTVDYIIMRTNPGGAMELLLGRKPNEVNFRFIGGFVDPSDTSLEAAACREVQEETSLVDFTFPCYVGSVRINDWRYQDEQDKIMTALFETYYWGTQEAYPADDIKELKWIPLKALTANILEPEHVKLLTIFKHKHPHLNV